MVSKLLCFIKKIHTVTVNVLQSNTNSNTNSTCSSLVVIN